MHMHVDIEYTFVSITLKQYQVFKKMVIEVVSKLPKENLQKQRNQLNANLSFYKMKAL